MKRISHNIIVTKRAYSCKGRWSISHHRYTDRNPLIHDYLSWINWLVITNNNRLRNWCWIILTISIWSICIWNILIFLDGNSLWLCWGITFFFYISITWRLRIVYKNFAKIIWFRLDFSSISPDFALISKKKILLLPAKSANFENEI